MVVRGPVTHIFTKQETQSLVQYPVSVTLSGENGTEIEVRIVSKRKSD